MVGCPSEVTGKCRLSWVVSSYVGAGTANPGPLQAQQPLLIAEPFTVTFCENRVSR